VVPQPDSRTAARRTRLRFCSGRDVRFIARPPPRSVRAAFPHTAPTSGPNGKQVPYAPQRL
jgi:hypothetical protein